MSVEKRSNLKYILVAIILIGLLLGSMTNNVFADDTTEEYTVKVINIDQKERPVYGFHFQLEEKDTHKVYDFNMMTEFEMEVKVPKGNYIFRTIKVPSEYKTDSRVLEFSFPYEINGEDLKQIIIYPKKEFKETVTPEIPEKPPIPVKPPIPPRPSTNDLWNKEYLIMMASGAMMMILVSIYSARRKRHREKK